MDYRELSRIAGDPAEVRSTAKMIKRLLGERISEWQAEFLSKLEKFDGPDRLSTRQCETLISMRETVNRRSEVGRYRASNLVALLAMARADLPEDQEARVLKLQKLGPSLALSDSEWRYVFAMCRELNIIDDPYISLH
jgi:hypothetical protein